MNAADHDILNTLIQAATLGVSADNGQPWSFRWQDSQLLLALDAARAKSFFDRKQFAAMFGLGSTLENLSIAAAHLGYDTHIELLPRGDSRVALPVARIRFISGAPGPHPLYPELSRRATNRRPYDKTPVLAEVRASLAKAFSKAPSVRLILTDSPERIRSVASLIAAADRIRFHFSSPDIHRDFFDCLRFTKHAAEESMDGLWVRCLEVKPPDLLALRLLAVWPIARVARYLGTARLFAQQTIALLRRTPLVALIIGTSEGLAPGTRTEIPTDNLFLTGGRLCQRLWLEATHHKLACQPMAVLPLFFAQHAVFGTEGFPNAAGLKVGKLKQEFSSLFGLGTNEHLLMILRLGYAPAPSARSFRRPAAEVFTADDSPLISA